MALPSRCPNPDCKGTGFEAVENTPEGSEIKLIFIQCSSCGTVVGVVDFYIRFNIGVMLRDIEDTLLKIVDKLAGFSCGFQQRENRKAGLKQRKEVITVQIKILGPGCPNCQKLEEMVHQALSELGVKADVEKIKDINEINNYVMVTPGLVINEKVKHSGKPLPSLDKVKGWIKEEMD